MIAVVNLDAIAGRGRPRLELAGDTPRSPAPGLVETVRARLGRRPARSRRAPSALRQLVDLGFPYSRYEQAPFVTRGIPAVTITTAADRPADGLTTSRAALDAARLGQIGRATQNAIDAMQQGVALEPGPSSYVYLGSRVVRGWAIELVLIGALLPFLAVTVDLFARCRRRRIRVAPALRSYRSRLGFWLWCGARLRPLRALRRVGQRRARPPSLSGVHWPAGALLGLAALAGLGWIVARDRLLPRRPVRRGGTDRRAHGRAPRAQRRRAPRRRDEPVRARLPPAVAPRLGLAATGAPQPGRGARGRAARRLRRACTPHLVVRRPVRPRLGCAVVHRVALRARVCAAAALRHRTRLGRRRPGSSSRSQPAGTRRTRPRRSARRAGRCGKTVRSLVLAQRRGGAHPNRHDARYTAEMPRLARISGALMLGAGVLTLVWALLVWQWQDPFTALYTHWQQHQLAQSLDRELAAYRPLGAGAAEPPPSGAPSRSTRSAFGARRGRARRSAGSRSAASACTWCSSTGPTTTP